jgi:hypothetical protein
LRQRQERFVKSQQQQQQQGGGGGGGRFGASSSSAVSSPREDFDPERLRIVGECQVLEKDYLRLTAAPDPVSVRPESVLRRYMVVLLEKWESGAVHDAARTYSVILLFFLLFLFVMSLSLSLSYPSIAACLHSLTPPGTNLTIIPPSLNHQSITKLTLLITLQVLALLAPLAILQAMTVAIAAAVVVVLKMLLLLLRLWLRKRTYSVILLLFLLSFLVVSSLSLSHPSVVAFCII